MLNLRNSTQGLSSINNLANNRRGLGLSASGYMNPGNR